MMRFHFRFLGFIIGAGILLSASAYADAPRILVLEAKGTINPVLAGYIARGISAAESQKAVAVVIQLDTPGGLDSSMRDIVQRINRSSIPVVVYVSPAGARAASAGAFITMASHVAAMAPDTAIGAAHPVAGGGGQMDETMSAKVTNDAVAYIKSISESRGRNAEWAEKAVRESISSSAEDARQEKVVDLVARDIPSLVEQLDGRHVKLSSGETTLNLQGYQLVHENMTTVESFLFAISDPNVAYILLSLAMLGLFLELSNPGAILPGIVGGISLFLALYSLGMLPVNIAGLLLILLAFLLFLAEVFVTSHGMLTVGGVISLTLGSLILISSNDAPYLAIDRRLIALVVTLVTAFFVLVVGAVVRTQRGKSATGREGMVGMMGVARSELDPDGIVFLHGERWSAHSQDGRVEAGERVLVTQVEGLLLQVSKAK